MDAGRTVTAIVSIVVLTLMVTIVFQFVFGAMDVRGDPIRWQQWNGYKAGAAFTAIENSENTGKTAENYVQRQREISTSDRYICSNELPGFITDGTVNIVTYMPGKNCLDPSASLKLVLHTDASITNLRLDTKPSRIETGERENGNE